MFTLAKLLNHTAGFQITFVNTHHNHALLQRSLDTSAFTTSFPGFYFSSLPDVVTHDGRKSNVANVSQLLFSIRDSKSDFLRLMVDLCSGAEGGRCAPTCVIADGIMSFGIDLAEEIGIPVLTFRTFSAVCLWVYFNLDKLKQEALIPMSDNADMDELITAIPGLEGILRFRDLPSICRSGRANQLKYFIDETESMRRAAGLILNTFDELESPVISKLSTIFPKTYPVGPLHGLFNNLVKEERFSSSNGGLWEEDKACMTWLDSQPSRSVIYVSFGSLVVFTEDQFTEFWHGLVNAGKPFLWVIRPDSVDGLAQSGQDTWDRSTVEKMVRDLMDDRRDEIMKSTAEIARLARDSIKEGGGSSFCNLEKLIEDIRAMC
ncbi:7-deoxyloganetic acid glucosyl transferase [Linum perenne]